MVLFRFCGFQHQEMIVAPLKSLRLTSSIAMFTSYFGHGEQQSTLKPLGLTSSIAMFISWLGGRLLKSHTISFLSSATDAATLHEPLKRNERMSELCPCGFPGVWWVIHLSQALSVAGFFSSLFVCFVCMFVCLFVRSFVCLCVRVFVVCALSAHVSEYLQGGKLCGSLYW